jgi:hypothetical protein
MLGVPMRDAVRVRMAEALERRAAARGAAGARSGH